MIQDLHKPQWHVLTVKKGCEKKVSRDLAAAGFEVLLPIRLQYRNWSDRKKQVEEALFKGYAFVCVSEAQRKAVFVSDRIKAFLWQEDKACILRDSEVELLRYLSSGIDGDVTMKYERIPPGRRVEVLEGPLSGMQGIVRGAGTHTTLDLELPSMGCFASVRIQHTLVKLL